MFGGFGHATPRSCGDSPFRPSRTFRVCAKHQRFHFGARNRCSGRSDSECQCDRKRSNKKPDCKYGDQRLGRLCFPWSPAGELHDLGRGPGFKKLSDSNIPLDANDKLALGDIVLQVGAVTESVEVPPRRHCCRRKAWSVPPRLRRSRWKTSRSTAAIRWKWRNSFRVSSIPRISRWAAWADSAGFSRQRQPGHFKPAHHQRRQRHRHRC